MPDVEAFVEVSPNDGLAPSWTAPSAAYSDGGGYASTTTNDASFSLMDFNLADVLPASCAITGIRVRVDGYWHDTTGSSDISKCGVRVDLTWDGGTTYTTGTPGLKYCKGFQEDNEQTFYVGGPTDTWGRSWTRAEVISDTGFRVRIRSLGSMLVDVPEWRVDYVEIAVYYYDTTSRSVRVTDKIEIRDSFIETSHRNIRVGDTLRLTDAGSSGYLISSPMVNNVQLGGDVVTITANSTFSDFDSSALPHCGEAYFIQLKLGRYGPVFYIGDTNCSNSFQSLMRYAEFGLMEVQIDASGNFGQRIAFPVCTIRIANREYNNISTSQRKTISEWLGSATGFGGEVSVFCFVRATPNDTWYQRMLFEGPTQEINITPDAVEIMSVAVNHGNLSVPDQIVTPETYEYGTMGEMIEESQGKVIPFGLGRFSYDAVEFSFETGHPFAYNGTTNPNAYHNLSVFAGMMGLKYPMCPTVPAVRKALAYTAGPPQVGWGTNHHRVILLNGSKVNTELRIYLPSTTATYTDYRYSTIISTDFPSDLVTPATGDPYYRRWPRNILDYTNMCTWEGGDDGGAAFFVRDRSHKSIGRLYNGAPLDPVIHLGNSRWKWLSAGSLEAAFGSDAYTTGKAKEAFAYFVNQNAYSTTREFMPTCLQAIGLKFQGLTEYATSTQGWYFANFNTTDPMNCVDLKDPHSKTVFAANTALWGFSGWYHGQSTYQFPLQFRLPGQLYGIMVMAFYNQAYDWYPIFKVRLCGPDEGVVIPGVFDTVNLVYSAYRNCEVSPHRSIATHGNHNITMTGLETFPIWGGGTGYYQYSSYYVPNHTPALNNETRCDFWVFPKYAYRRVQLYDPNAVSSNPPYQEWPVIPNTNYDDAEGEALPGPAADLVWDGQYLYAPEPRMSGSNECSTWFPTTTDLSHPRTKFGWELCVGIRSQTQGHEAEMYAIMPVAVFDSRIASGERFDQWLRDIYDSPDNENVKKWLEPWEYRRWYTSGFAGVLQSQHRQETVEQPKAGGVYLVGRSLPFVERPKDIAETLIQHFCDAFTFNGRAQGTEFGSFDVINASLPALTGGDFIRMTTVFDKQTTLIEALNEVAAQVGCLIAEQVKDNGYQWRMFADVANPASTTPSRMYRTDGYYFSPDDLLSDGIEVVLSPTSSVSNNITCEYGWHRPSNSFAGEVKISRHGTNLRAPSSYSNTYKNAAGESFYDNGNIENPMKLRFPDLWDRQVVEAIARYTFSTFWQRRVNVKFTTSIRHTDLQIGHVIRFDNALGDLVKFPGQEGTSNWADHQFNVIGVSIAYADGAATEVTVLAQECFTWAHFP